MVKIKTKRKTGTLEGGYIFFSPVQGHLNQSIKFAITFFLPSNINF